MSNKVGDSLFWNLLWKKYPTLPSVVLCRVPELEYASTLNINCKVLDHCCGDGIFASLAWPGRIITAGCDINASGIDSAKKLGMYERLDVCDASKRLPYDDKYFDIVFNNSALEHIPDLESTLSEVSRVLSPKGVFAFNILNHRFYNWWPLKEQTKKDYYKFQPIYHILDINEWIKILNKHGLEVVSFEGYFDKGASQLLASIDYDYSNVGLNGGHSFTVSSNRMFPTILEKYWRSKLSKLTWKTEPEVGGGYFIKAIKK